MSRKRQRIVVVLAGGLVMGLLTLIGGCVRSSNGVWYFHEAKLPADWPALTKVGQVELKTYPTYREAIVTGDAVPTDQGAMFNVLFQHIKQNEIAMTAPVDMGITEGDKPAMRSMSFLYDIPDRGPTGEAGNVTVRDVPSLTVVSIGVRGGYNEARYGKAISTLRIWLDEHADTWRATGDPRVLGYNSPFIPAFWRYSEAQIPIEALEE